MCKTIEDMRSQAYQDATRDYMVKVAVRMLNDGSYSFDQIVDISGLSAQKVQELKEQMTNAPVD